MLMSDCAIARGVVDMPMSDAWWKSGRRCPEESYGRGDERFPVHRCTFPIQENISICCPEPSNKQQWGSVVHNHIAAKHVYGEFMTAVNLS
jgi:hypothetical protein